MSHSVLKSPDLLRDKQTTGNVNHDLFYHHQNTKKENTAGHRWPESGGKAFPPHVRKCRKQYVAKDSCAAWAQTCINCMCTCTVTCLPYNSPETFSPGLDPLSHRHSCYRESFEGYHKSARPGPGDAQTLLKNDLAEFLSSLWYSDFPFFPPSSQVSRCFSKKKWLTSFQIPIITIATGLLNNIM